MYGKKKAKKSKMGYEDGGLVSPRKLWQWATRWVAM